MSTLFKELRDLEGYYIFERYNGELYIECCYCPTHNTFKENELVKEKDKLLNCLYKHIELHEIQYGV